MLLDRRTLLRSGTAALVAPPLMAQAPGNKDDARPRSAAEWMDEAIVRSRGTPNGTLQIGRFRDPYYYLLNPISWRPSENDGPLPTVAVPNGFVTDLTSIPRLFWTMLRPDGDYAYAAILHDYLYWTQTTSRETADRIFKAGMADFSIAAATIAAIYNAVRVGGGSAWRSNGELRRQGEKRILRRYPTNPQTTWMDWKREPGVLQ
jgi:hypothetical protein